MLKQSLAVCIYKLDERQPLEQIMVKELVMQSHKNDPKYHTSFGTRGVFIRYMVTALLLVVLISGCSREKGEDPTVEENSMGISVGNTFFGALWMHGQDLDYHPMYAAKTKHEKDFEDKYLPFKGNRLSFSYDTFLPEKITYTVYGPDREAIETGLVVNFTWLEDTKYVFDVELEGDYTKDEAYELELLMTYQGDKAYYYTGFKKSLLLSRDMGIDNLLELMTESLKEEDISIVDSPLIWITDTSDQETTYKVRLTGAKRLENGFEYYSMTKLYRMKNLDKVEEVFSFQTDKQRFYFDKDLGWVLGKQVLESESSLEIDGFAGNYEYRQASSENFDVYYNDYEMVIFDKKESYLHKIVHMEKFDSDYVYDEYSDHKIEVLEVTDSGQVNFIIYGYQNMIEGQDNQEVDQRIGMGFYSYYDGQIARKGFMEKGMPTQELFSDLSNMTYYSQEAHKLYFWNNQSLYSLSFVEGDFVHEGYFLKGNFYSSEGMIAWQGSDDKLNASVFIVNLQGQGLESYNLYRSGENKRLLGLGNGQVIVGVYDLEDTFEYLDQTIEYPYHRLDLYDYKGQIMDKMEVGSPYFYGQVYENASSGNDVNLQGKFFVDVLKMEESGRLKSYNVYFDVEETIEITNPIIETQVTDQVNDKFTIDVPENTFPDKDIIYLSNPIFSGNPTKLVMSYAPLDVYEVRSDGRVYYAESLASALISSHDARQVTIEYVEALNGENMRTLMYDSGWKSQREYLEDIMVIPQRPELPRGCEVTSLSIMLHHYMETAPDKIQLASELDQQVDQYAEIDGVIHFTDMHTAFAGSMDDTSQPGLGVYIEPVYKLAKEYIHGDSVTKGVFDLSGMSFDQMLTLVSKEIPVLVIIPNRYRKVPDYAIEVWKTPSGFMEVTYQEHSVVVMGFDENYIYYSDPSKEIIDKKPLSEFKEGWESIGSQGMIILE